MFKSYTRGAGLSEQGISVGAPCLAVFARHGNLHAIPTSELHGTFNSNRH